MHKTKNTDSRQFGVETSGDASELDFKLLEDLVVTRDGKQSEKEASSSGTIKTEPLSPEEQQANELAEFHASCGEKVRYFQGLELDSRTLLSSLQKKAWTEQLQDAVRKHQTRITAVLKILNKAITDPLTFKKFEKLKGAMSVVAKIDIELKEGATGFGVKTKKARKA